MADKRAFAKFDVGYLDNPKIMAVLDQSAHAVLMHAASVMYSAQHLTDGGVSEKAMQRKVGGTDADAVLLVEAGLWHREGHDCPSCPQVEPGKAWVHDYLEHNRSAHEAKRVSDVAKDAAHARWNAPSNALRNAPGMRSASVTHSVEHASSNADVMPRKRERERDKNSSSAPASQAPEFDQFWAEYPRKIGKQAALKAYKAALKLTTPEKILTGVRSLAKGVAGADQKFTPHPATWLNQGRWDDEATQPQQAFLSVVPSQYSWANQ